MKNVPDDCYFFHFLKTMPLAFLIQSTGMEYSCNGKNFQNLMLLSIFFLRKKGCSEQLCDLLITDILWLQYVGWEDLILHSCPVVPRSSHCPKTWGWNRAGSRYHSVIWRKTRHEKVFVNEKCKYVMIKSRDDEETKVHRPPLWNPQS